MDKQISYFFTQGYYMHVVLYSETCIKQTVAKVPKFISLICFKWNLY